MFATPLKVQAVHSSYWMVSGRMVTVMAAQRGLGQCRASLSQEGQTTMLFLALEETRLKSSPTEVPLHSEQHYQQAQPTAFQTLKQASALTTLFAEGLRAPGLPVLEDSQHDVPVKENV